MDKEQWWAEVMTSRNDIEACLHLSKIDHRVVDLERAIETSDAPTVHEIMDQCWSSEPHTIPDDKRQSWDKLRYLTEGVFPYWDATLH